MNKNNPIMPGCNYHTTWQSHKAMRFVLLDVKGDEAILTTRTTKKTFKTKVKDLIFIQTDHNKKKLEKFIKELER